MEDGEEEISVCGEHAGGNESSCRTAPYIVLQWGSSLVVVLK